jgi:stage II sporulation protein D
MNSRRFSSNPTLTPIFQVGRNWLSDAVYNDAGAVDSCRIGGIQVGGVEVRSIFSLRSTKFEYAVKDGAIIFTTEGYGHGVGMSQYGANAMAADGYDHAAILEHYYTGAQYPG